MDLALCEPASKVPEILVKILSALPDLLSQSLGPGGQAGGGGEGGGDKEFTFSTSA